MRLGSLGPTELILILLVIVLIFGASKLGDIGGALGKSVREFKNATKEDDKQKEAEAAAAASTTTPSAQTPPAAASAERTTAAPIGDFRPTDAKPS